MGIRAKLGAGMAVLALLGVACAEQTVRPGPGQLAVVADATAAAGTARMAASFTTTMPPIGEYAMTMEGVVDFARQAVHLTMSVTGAPEGAMSGETIMLDGFSYMRADTAQPGVPAGTWVRDELPERAGGWGDPFTGGQPTDMVDALRELGLPVEVVGSERVRGVDTTRYQVLATAEDLIRAEHQEGDIEGPDFGDLGDMETVIDVWVDDQDLLRRMRTETDVSAAYSGWMEEEQVVDARTIMEFELFDYGVDVDITAPPEDEVVDAEPLMIEEEDWEIPPPGAPDGWVDDVVDVEVEVARPQVAVDVPDEFPLHPAATVVDAQATASGHVLELRVATFGDDALARVVAYYAELLEDHGWRIVARSSAGSVSPAGEGSREETLEVAGHGWHGSVTLQEVRGAAEVTITVRLDRG
jgi:hypothetical protein